MVTDLYAADLDRLTFDDVSKFVSIGQEEGTRLDYKDQVPQDLGDVVAAFANTYGGLIVLGVSKTNKTPTTIPGILKKQADLKTQLTSKIVDTVYPRPLFEVGVALHSNVAGHDVAVIRVYEGYETPYMYLPHKKVSIRVADKCERASLADLEQLFARRENEPEETPKTAHGLWVQRTNEDRGGDKRSSTFLRLWIWPTRPLNIRLDRNSEERFHAQLCQDFRDYASGISICDRSAEHVEFLYRSSTADSIEARWKISCDGAFGFATEAVHPKAGGIPLFDMVSEAVTFLKATKNLFALFGWPGRIVLQGEISLGDAPVFPYAFDGATKSVPGIGPIPEKGTGRGYTPAKDVFDRAEPALLAPFISELLLSNLRSQRGADIDYGRLEAFVLSRTNSAD